MRRDLERLQDMLEAIGKIESKISTQDAFAADEMLQVWIVYHLQILGEAASKLTPALHAQYPELPWKQIVGMRNILIHDYVGIDQKLVWAVVERDLSLLKQQLTAMLQSLSSTAESR